MLVSSPNKISPLISTPVRGDKLSIGQGFEALNFKYTMFQGQMDSLIMADHYRMTKPTFGAHPHAGLAAVSLLFEDTEGQFHNQDSLGNDFDLEAGDLYWLQAGTGAVHDEKPRNGAHIHGLQMFINLPDKLRRIAPKSFHIKAADMPISVGEGYRVRQVIKQQASAAEVGISMLDGTLNATARYDVELASHENAWLYLVAGELVVEHSAERQRLQAGQAIVINNEEQLGKQQISLSARSNSHFVWLATPSYKETFVQRGPFAKANLAEIQHAHADYAAGKFGQI